MPRLDDAQLAHLGKVRFLVATWKDETAILLGKNIIDLLDTIDALCAERESAVEQRDRYHLWTSHGHDGLYGDDGEMQCAECHVDYKRDSFAIVQAAATKAKAAWLASLRESVVREALEHGRLEGIKWAHSSPCGCIHGNCVIERRIVELERSLAALGKDPAAAVPGDTK